MKTIIYIAVLLLVVFLYSCNQVEEQKENARESESVECVSIPADKSYNLSFAPPRLNDSETDEKIINDNSKTDKKKIIKDGNISIKVTDIEKSKKNVDLLIKKWDAYYENEKFINNENNTSYNLTIRLPSANFEKILTLVENSIGEIIDKNIQARDVTEEYIDTETRLNSKKNYLKKYNELLNKATKVEDIITIQDNIRTLQEEIESKEGKLKYLNDQIAYSTLNVVLFREKEFLYKPQKQDKFTERIKTSLNNGWANVINFILWIIKSWPIILIILLLGFLVRVLFMRNKKNKKNKN